MSARPASVAARRTVRGAAVQPPPTREVILDTAEKLFASRGVDGVAVRDLARDMGLTAPSLYNHFSSKQALYDAVLERGLRPIVELLAGAWQPGGLHPDQIRMTVDRLLTHLARHPHLAPLLQRALLEDSKSVKNLLARWVGPLYREGFTIIRNSADDAGWNSDELPHLALGLFGMVFAYFTNTVAVNAITAGRGNPLSPSALAVQRQFLEKAVFRLLGSQPTTSTRGARADRSRSHNGN